MVAANPRFVRVSSFLEDMKRKERCNQHTKSCPGRYLVPSSPTIRATIPQVVTKRPR